MDRAFRGHINGKIFNLPDELTRDASTNPRREELMGGSEEQIAQKKAVGFLYIALGETARKTLLDRKPNMDIKTMNLDELL